MDAETFRDLALRELEAVHRMAFHLTRQADDAQDLVQETYLRAFRAAASFELRDPEKGMRPWLFKILHNTFFTQLEKKKRAPTAAGDAIEAAADQAADEPPAWDLASLDWEQVDQRLVLALAELPVHYREVILLWAVEGLKYKEIAETLDVPLGTVMSRLYRARKVLSQQLASLAREHGIHVAE